MGFLEKMFGPSKEDKAMLARAEKASAEAAARQAKTLKMLDEYPEPLTEEDILPVEENVEVSEQEVKPVTEMPAQEQPKKAA